MRGIGVNGKSSKSKESLLKKEIIRMENTKYTNPEQNEELKEQENEELLEEVEEVVTASWTGCANCC
jgi:hypothetical protein